MLPGGLSVIGLFVMATQDAMKSAQVQLRKVTPDALLFKHLDLLNIQLISILSSLLCSSWYVYSEIDYR